jgi:hypothetical protein
MKVFRYRCPLLEHPSGSKRLGKHLVSRPYEG